MKPGFISENIGSISFSSIRFC